jgi:hypothetical protein
MGTRFTKLNVVEKQNLQSIYLIIMIITAVVEIYIVYKLDQSYRDRYFSNTVASLFRFLADAQTESARNYVATGQKIYNDEYLMSEDVEMGDEKWGKYPKNVLLPSDTLKSFNTLIKEANFTIKESYLVKKVKPKIDDITFDEITAINWADGYKDTEDKDALSTFKRQKNKAFIRFAESSPKEPDEALLHLYNNEYIMKKAEIHGITKELEKMVNKRKTNVIDNYILLLKVWSIIVFISIASTVILIRKQIFI